jgi:hypothetical protein
MFGVAAGTLCNFATQLKFLCGYDDALDVRIAVSPIICIRSHCLSPITDLRGSRHWWHRWQSFDGPFRSEEHRWL